MRISEFQKYLAAVKRTHGDIEMIESRYSDYGPMGPVPLSTDVKKYNASDDPSNWVLVQAAPRQNGAYLMRDHHSITLERSANFKTYLLYKGN